MQPIPHIPPIHLIPHIPPIQPIQPIQPMPTPLYQDLDLQLDATKIEIKKAYLRLIKHWHPDQALNTEDRPRYQLKYDKIIYAYRILSDPDKRLIYDWYVSRDLDYADLQRDHPDRNRYLDPDSKSFNNSKFNQEFMNQTVIDNLSKNYQNQEITENTINDLVIQRSTDPEVKIQEYKGQYTLSKFNQIYQENLRTGKWKMCVLCDVKGQSLPNNHFNPEDIDFNQYQDQVVKLEPKLTKEDFDYHKGK